MEIVFQDDSRGFTRAAEPAFQRTGNDGDGRAIICLCPSAERRSQNAETSVQPMFDLLGTAPSDKKLALFPPGHLPPINETARVSLPS